MKKIVLIIGIIIGTITITNGIIMVNMIYSNPTLETNDFLGYVVLVLVFSLIFVGIKNYRDKKSDGIITFGTAFKIGLYITLVASTVYVVVWLFYFYLFVPDFMEVYKDFVLNTTPPAELAEKTKQMNEYSKMYENPLFVILLTYAEVFPIGLVVTLFSSLILKKNNIKGE